MKKKLLLFFLAIIFLYAIGGIVYLLKPEKEKVKLIDEIKGYPYVLKSNAKEAMKREFNHLKSNLESDEIDEEAYATSIAKLFIIDLYTISNKFNKYDVGGVDYVYLSAVDNYKLKVKDTLYKYVEDNHKGKRKQELPEVTSVDLKEIEELEFEIADEVFNGYKVYLTVEYLNDLGYDEEVEVSLVKEDKIYYVTEKK